MAPILVLPLVDNEVEVQKLVRVLASHVPPLILVGIGAPGGRVEEGEGDHDELSSISWVA